jgi:hypothetical protein
MLVISKSLNLKIFCNNLTVSFMINLYLYLIIKAKELVQHCLDDFTPVVWNYNIPCHRRVDITFGLRSPLFVPALLRTLELNVRCVQRSGGSCLPQLWQQRGHDPHQKQRESMPSTSSAPLFSVTPLPTATPASARTRRQYRPTLGHGCVPNQMLPVFQRPRSRANSAQAPNRDPV